MAKKIYKTARGAEVNLDSLRLQNENVIAVGNMRVNARGDELGPGGQIVRTRNQVLKDRERIHTMVPTDEPVYASLEEALAAQAEADANDPAMMDNLETSEPVTTETDPEPVVEVTAPAATSVRGNLASAVTKQSTVKTPVTRNTRQTGLKRI
jgi:hypothetical protein